MDKLKDALYPFRFALILLGGLLLVIIGVKIFGKVSTYEKKTDQPITSIEAECSKTYHSINDIDLKDFTIKAEHSDGIKNMISNEDVILNTDNCKPVGEKVEVEIMLTEHKDIKCTCEVKIKREKIMGFQCGYPTVTDVIAVLYSNGELCFEGKGDVLVFYEGEQPWLNYEEAEECPIISVSFQKEVTPTNMNFWFKGLKTLTYVEPIPSSVRTMVRTFEGCENLSAMADWTNSESLLNINEAYKDCKSLVVTYPIPKRVRIAKMACAGCTELQVAPDFTNAESLVNTTEMFKDCDKLIQTNMPMNVTDISGMFKNCINLKTMPDLPGSVVIMKDCFSGDTNLTTLSNIPLNVDDVTSAFSGCEMITGEMLVNCNPHQFNNMFQNAALATKVNLTGNSLMLDVLANTSDTGNIYINKSKPNPALKTYKDVFLDD